MILLRIAIIERKEGEFNHVILEAHPVSIGGTKREVDSLNLALESIKKGFEEKAPTDPAFNKMFTRFEPIKE